MDFLRLTVLYIDTETCNIDRISSSYNKKSVSGILENKELSVMDIINPDSTGNQM